MRSSKKHHHPIAPNLGSLTAACVWSQCEEHGIRFEHADEGGSDDEDWDDIQEEMEDFWMRDPKARLSSDTFAGAVPQSID